MDTLFKNCCRNHDLLVTTNAAIQARFKQAVKEECEKDAFLRLVVKDAKYGCGGRYLLVATPSGQDYRDWQWLHQDGELTKYDRLFLRSDHPDDIPHGVARLASALATSLRREIIGGKDGLLSLIPDVIVPCQPTLKSLLHTAAGTLETDVAFLLCSQGTMAEIDRTPANYIPVDEMPPGVVALCTRNPCSVYSMQNSLFEIELSMSCRMSLGHCEHQEIAATADFYGTWYFGDPKDFMFLRISE